MDTEKLDQLVAGRLPDRINAAIDKMEVSLEEMAIWQASKPSWYVTTRDGALVVQLNIRVPLKIAIGAVGFVVTTIGLALKYWPVLQTLVRPSP